tara:strand:- start:20 stop:715 length:696 start_codon:yes stop_codon:yes gene_type:complete
MEIHLTNYKNLTILRDDLIEGGSKMRFIHKLLEPNKKGYIYCSMGYGAFQVALSVWCKQNNKKCVIFTPDKKLLDKNTLKLYENGADVKLIKYGYTSVLNKRAKDFNINNDYQILHFGANCEIAIHSISDIMKQIIEKLGYEPKNIYCAVGSGTLLSGILKGTKKSIIHGVIIGKKFNIEHERIKLYKYPKPFSYESKLNIPFNSNKNYDRKVLEIALKHNIPKSFFWNVN